MQRICVFFKGTLFIRVHMHYKSSLRFIPLASCTNGISDSVSWSYGVVDASYYKMTCMWWRVSMKSRRAHLAVKQCYLHLCKRDNSTLSDTRFNKNVSFKFKAGIIHVTLLWMIVSYYLMQYMLIAVYNISTFNV